MQFGEMDRVITFQENTGTRDDAGQRQDSWTNISTRPKMFAMKRVDTGREGFEDSGKTANRREVYKIHYRTDLNTAMTVVDEDGLRWDIRSIEEYRRREALLVRVEWKEGKYES